MPITCTRCAQTAEPPPVARVAYLGAAQSRVLSEICDACWREWEGVEVKVINEYRLNFMDPQHRDTLRQACLDFFKLS